MATQLKPSVQDLYEQDYYAWTVAQAAELQRLAKRRTSSALDLEPLAEEVPRTGTASPTRRPISPAQLRR